ncbi:Aste57867_18944 [Aphanomyces stellatus]|uniref:Aste57867_18944 protein n=1 Tax=Aphanomyces stellatus TaxID=120398 RepID=A0A485LBC4_9STRA|nr:hypothetical protein As57867_018880 [Aphanomyces stellatus]VFT95674.1 Aste57867_18944 [Aphanomyces stellatus]
MIADSKSILAYYIHALKQILPQDSNLLQLEQMLLDIKADKPKESILFSGTRLRFDELEDKLNKLMTKLMEMEFHFRDDIYDAMNDIRQHEQLLCDLEEYVEADLPAKEHFLVNDCVQLRTRIRVMMRFMQAKLKSTFDDAAQTDFVMGPYRRNLAHAKKAVRCLQHMLAAKSLSENEVECKLSAIDDAIARAEEHDFEFDPTAFNYGRDSLVDAKARLIDEWRQLMRDVRSIKRALKGLSPAPSPLLSMSKRPASPSKLLL